MRKMVCVRDCHGFRGGTWRKGETVDTIDGENVPRHFVPVDDYEQFVEDENKPKGRRDIMKPTPQLSPVPQHLQGQGGISTVKPSDFRPAAPRAGEDI